MTSEQAQLVKEVYGRFQDSENERLVWTGIDETLCKLEWIDGDQLFREAEVIYQEYTGRKVKCNMVHTGTECFAPKIVGAVSAVLECYERSGQMTADFKYILQYFLALNHLKVIGHN